MPRTRGGFCIVNAEDPENPAIISTVDGRGITRAVCRYGNYAYFAIDSLIITDISEPSNPQRASSIGIGEGNFDIAAMAGYCCTAGEGPAISLVNISIPQEPFTVATWGASQTTRYVCMAERNDLIYIYTTGGDNFYLFQLTPLGISDTMLGPDKLAQINSYPNPFNASTSINYMLDKASVVKLAVYDIGGKEIAVILSGFQSGGPHSTIWDGTKFPSGTYFARLEADGKEQITKMILLK